MRATAATGGTYMKNPLSLRLMGGDRKLASEFATGFNPLHPYEYLRVLLLGLTLAFPNLRSDILVVGRKPNT